MITQFLKAGFLVATGRFLKYRYKGLLWVVTVWLALHFMHAEFVSYVELSGDTRYVLHASLLKLLLYALTIWYLCAEGGTAVMAEIASSGKGPDCSGKFSHSPAAQGR